jgi:hypothetical protein
MASMYNVADQLGGKLVAAQNAAASQTAPAPASPAPALTAPQPAPVAPAATPNSTQGGNFTTSPNPFQQSAQQPAPSTSPGILAGAMPSTPSVTSVPTTTAMRDPSTQGYEVQKATGTTWDVNNPQTVQGQVAGIIDQNTPLMRRAAARSDEQMNSRGLLNSSIAVGASQGALYDAALPIAQQDASTYANAGKYNADVANQTSQFNASAGNTAIQNDAKNNLTAQLANQDAAVKMASQQYDGALKMVMQNADSATKVQLQNIDAYTRTTLADIEARYKNQLQTSASMSSTYQSMIDGITRIMLDQNLDASGKQAAIGNLTTMYNGAMQQQSAITGLNLGSLLDPTAFGAKSGGAETRDKNTQPIGGGGYGGTYDPNNMPGGA